MPKTPYFFSLNKLIHSHLLLPRKIKNEPELHDNLGGGVTKMTNREQLHVKGTVLREFLAFFYVMN